MAHSRPRVWKLVLPYLLITALLMQAGTGLTCYNYSGIDAGSFTRLTHPTVSCEPEHQTCMEAINTASNGQRTVTVVHRGCSDKKPTTHPTSSTLMSANPNLLSYSYFQFCNTSLCNWLGGSGHTTEPLHNGAECPACLAVAPEDCADAQKIRCLGEQTYCFNGTRTVSTGGAKISMVLQTCMKTGTCHLSDIFQDLITIEDNCFSGMHHANTRN